MHPNRNSAMKVNSTYLNFSIMSKFHSILQALALLLLPSLAAAQCDSTFDCSDKEEGRSPTSRAAGQAPCSNSQEVLALLRWTERALDLPRWSPVKYNAAWVTSVTAWTVARGPAVTSATVKASVPTGLSVLGATAPVVFL